jgi:hypothetical protein
MNKMFRPIAAHRRTPGSDGKTRPDPVAESHQNPVVRI